MLVNHYQTMKHADIIIPHGAQNHVAIDFVVKNLKLRLRQRGLLAGTQEEKKDSLHNDPFIP